MIQGMKRDLVLGISLRLLICPLLVIGLAVLLRRRLGITSVEMPGIIAFAASPVAVEGGVPEDRQPVFFANEGLGSSMRIPVGEESKHVLTALNVPNGWMMPCYIGIGYPREDAYEVEQHLYAPEQKMHFGEW